MQKAIENRRSLKVPPEKGSKLAKRKSLRGKSFCSNFPILSVLSVGKEQVLQHFSAKGTVARRPAFFCPIFNASVEEVALFYCSNNSDEKLQRSLIFGAKIQT